MNIKRVAKWARMGFFKARKLRFENPYYFNRILGWCDVEAEMREVRDAHDKWTRENADRVKAAAQ